MNEIQFWTNHVKRALHSQHHHRVAWKVGTSTRAGILDICYRNEHGEVAWLELKRIPEWPARDTTPIHIDISIEQHAHLREWCEGDRGHGFVLLSIETQVILFPWYVHNTVEQDNIPDLELAGWERHKDIWTSLAPTLNSMMGGQAHKIKDAFILEVTEE